MAGIFEDDLFDSGWLGRNLTFRDLSPERPYLILNATDATSVEDSEEGAFKLFTFTEEDFQIAEQLVNKENNCLQEVRKKLLPDGAVAVR